MCQSSVPNMILTVTLNAAIDKRYVVEGYQVGEVMQEIISKMH